MSKKELSQKVGVHPGSPSYKSNYRVVCLILLFVCRQNAKAIITFVIRRIALSLFGRVLKSIASQTLGKNTNKYKLIVFIVGAFFAGIA